MRLPTQTLQPCPAARSPTGAACAKLRPSSPAEIRLGPLRRWPPPGGRATPSPRRAAGFRCAGGTATKLELRRELKGLSSRCRRRSLRPRRLRTVNQVANLITT